MAIGIACAKSSEETRKEQSSEAREAEIDQVSTELLRFATRAQLYYAKPRTRGGGEKSFTGYILPSNSTDNGTYTVLVTDQKMTITGSCKMAVKSDGTPVTIVLTVFPKSVSTQVSR